MPSKELSVGFREATERDGYFDIGLVDVLEGNQMRVAGLEGLKQIGIDDEADILRGWDSAITATGCLMSTQPAWAHRPPPARSGRKARWTGLKYVLQSNHNSI